MIDRLKDLLSNTSVTAKSIRGSGLTILSFLTRNVFRLGSNLILTRLLFPEAFGLMALVQVFITGMGMFSDVGIRTSVIRNARGDDPDFLNTAWTLQIIRGILLSLGACALAYPAAVLYDTPLLLMILPVAGLNALVTGFSPTRVLTANRHLTLGRVTLIDLSSQIVGIVAMVIMAYIWASVWALVIGNLLGTVFRVILQYRFLPGIRNRLQWDRSAFSELFNFGKFIFLSTAMTFFINQGDKAVLSAFVTLAELGVYNIAYFLGAVPLLFCTALNAKVIQPLLRMKPVHNDPRNQKKVFKARRLVIGFSILISICLGFSGIALVDVMYDERFALAGPIVVWMSVCLIPQLTFMGYNQVLLANGDSQKFFLLSLVLGSSQMALMLLGVMWFGIFGVILAPAIATLLAHPLRVRWIAPYGGWDNKADITFVLAGIGIAGIACWLHWDAVLLLLP